jgi:hypothetical protein
MAALNLEQTVLNGSIKLQVPVPLCGINQRGQDGSQPLATKPVISTR